MAWLDIDVCFLLSLRKSWSGLPLFSHTQIDLLGHVAPRWRWRFASFYLHVASLPRVFICMYLYIVTAFWTRRSCPRGLCSLTCCTVRVALCCLITQLHLWCISSDTCIHLKHLSASYVPVYSFILSSMLLGISLYSDIHIQKAGGRPYWTERF